jgi:hypothetical protein
VHMLFFGGDGTRGLNSGLLTYIAGALLLELCLHFTLVILEMGSQELFAWAGLEP